MNRKILTGCLFAVMIISAVQAQDKGKKTAPLTPASADTSKSKKTTGIADKVKSSKKTPGLFTIYQDTATGGVQLYIKKEQLGKEYIYQSFSISGPTFFA